jgi:hypothetical protein
MPRRLSHCASSVLATALAATSTLKQLSGDELYGEQDTERNDHEVIGIAEDGHEVGDKIDGERA